MNTPQFTPQEQAQIEAGLTEAQAVERINHLQQVAWHQANVGTFSNPELEF